MKDYTISHPCGLEETCLTLREAKRAALKHKRQCQLNASEEVYIDEYDLDAGEMSDRWWKV